MTSAFLRTPLSSVLGGKTATALAKSLEIRTVEDLLRHYPRRYAERAELTDLASLRDKEHVTLLADVVSVTVRKMRERRGTILEAVISDGQTTMKLAFFNQKWRQGDLRAGRRGLFSGQVSTFNRMRQLTHPDFELFPEGVTDDPLRVLEFAGALIPIYSASAAITSWEIRKSVRVLLDQLPELPDPLPDDVLAEQGLMSLTEALRAVHRPVSREESQDARRRLRFEEAFTLQVVLAQRRAEATVLPATRRAPSVSPLVAAFDARLPFTLTDGQREVTAEIEADLARAHPMHRLLQGDVGSGKTVVALRAMLRVVDAGGQAALLAPTEVLAAQHLRSITHLLGPLAERGRLGGSDVSTRVTLLTGSQRTAHRRQALLDIVSGEAGIVIGTHALIQEHVDFHDLALVVVDEQHRFGVEQRAALAAKSRDGSRPHVLVMTATPIPRTVAMTVFGDVDVSTLAELPAGRSPIATHIVSEHENPHFAARVWERVREEVERGGRVFVVCPRIGDSDQADDDGADLVMADEEPDSEFEPASITGVVPFAASLAEGELAGVRVGVLHGRMAADDKEDAMRRFSDPDAPDGYDVLVATTVIEVGVDVPAATTMVIMDADRFGMSQLHQLRGRVGRGSLPGLCLLMTKAEAGSPARERLNAVASTTDGFVLAALDLTLRSEGDVLGRLQSGHRRSLRLLEVARHEDVIVRARVAARSVVDADPSLSSFPSLADVVMSLREDEQSDYLEKG